MPRKRTLAELLDDIAERVDSPTFDTDTFVTKSAMTRWINQSIRVLGDNILDAFGEEYAAKEDTINAVAGTNAYALPADYLRTIHMRVDVAGSVVPLRRANSMSVGQEPGGSPPYRDVPFGYNVSGSNVEFWPPARQAETVTHRYVSTLFVFDNSDVAIEDLVNTTDYFNGINGWEEWIVLHCCIKHANKEEQEQAGFASELALIEQSINRNKGKRSGEPARTRNVYGNE